jgi:hypothetical protein
MVGRIRETYVRGLHFQCNGFARKGLHCKQAISRCLGYNYGKSGGFKVLVEKAGKYVREILGALMKKGSKRTYRRFAS